ncbi:hypothetical protein HPB47_015010 [Ixodes persulcatus]|uniref:Uncharacterized protein n=1 Tax=Ixodes persulcatus TaxID=34615 RepID=A0AC60QUV9_IXOPE|nr:hypothetical protein HPB47_015010 [Ixodes persulcatus]
MTPRFCHDHFDQSEFFCAEDTGRSQLRWNAMPTLLLPVEDVIEASPPKRQKVVALPSSPLSPGVGSISSGSDLTYSPTRDEDFESTYKQSTCTRNDKI